MSQIFDGLQRAEGERAGTTSSTISGVTELLQQAERRAASTWEATVQSGLLHQPMDSDVDVPTKSPRLSPIITPPSVSVGADDLLTDGRLALFGKLASLKVTLPTENLLLPSLTDRGSPAAEAFRLLSVRLRHLRRDKPLKKILITSTIPREGKSLIAANLACTLALRTQQKILVLEGDLRRPSLSKMFGLGKNPGLCEWLDGEGNLATSIYKLEGPNLWFLPAGSSPSNALELLQSGKLSTLMDQLTTLFDWIIIDSPPVLPLADTSVWMRLADGILLTTRPGTTEKKRLQRGLEAIESKKLLGALVNSSSNAAAADYYYQAQEPAAIEAQ